MKSEVELLRPVVQWLRDQRWEVFQEVATGYGPRCDIVARQGPVLWAIEGKMSLNFQVLGQIWHWRPFAHYISIVVPKGKWMMRSAYGCEVISDLLRWRGIGCLYVENLSDDEREYHCAVHEYVKPRLHRRIQGKLEKYLVAESQNYAEAGNAESKFWSPFKNTVAEIHRSLKAAGDHGLTMRDLVENIHHHYHCSSTARSCLNQWFNKGIVPDVTRVDNSRPTRWKYQPKIVDSANKF